MPDFLFELGTEEIPAGVLSDLSKDLAAGVEARLKEQRVSYEILLSGGAPRRIGFIVQGLPERQPDLDETVVGPQLSIARGKDGGWTQAAQGFAKKNGIGLDSRVEVQGPKGQCIGFSRKISGRPVSEILGGIVPAAIDAIYLPKSMKWGSGEHAFVRPVRWVLALLDESVVDMEVKGVRSGRVSRGHRIHGRQAIEVPSAKDYFKMLQREFVIPDPDQRRALISAGLKERATALGGVPIDDPGLVETVSNLCEHPVVIDGTIPEEYLSLPKEILITCLREHQKFFVVLDRSGNPMPAFLSVIDAEGDPKMFVRTGNENVTVSRLADARFFFEHDKEVKLDRRLDEIKGIVYHPKIGTYFDKAKRLESLAKEIATAWELDPEKAARAALLCKADLASLLVQEKEFTSLQGIAGGLYAFAQGEDPAVARAIREHYRPSSMTDELPGDPGCPSTYYGRVVSACDKLDTVMEFFKIGMVPSGSKDPFALRRAAAGAVRILADRSMPGGRGPSFDISNWANRAANGVGKKILDFLAERLRSMWEQDFAYDEINAVLAGGVGVAWEMQARLEAVRDVRKEFPEDFDAISVAFKRSKNILKEMPKVELNPGLFKPPDDKEGAGERALHSAYESVRGQVMEQLDSKDYSGALRRLAGIRPAVDKFFDDILVMCDPYGKDPVKTAIQNNRLALLRCLVSLFDRVADFSEIVPKGQ